MKKGSLRSDYRVNLELMVFRIARSSMRMAISHQQTASYKSRITSEPSTHGESQVLSFQSQGQVRES